MDFAPYNPKKSTILPSIQNAQVNIPSFETLQPLEMPKFGSSLAGTASVSPTGKEATSMFDPVSAGIMAGGSALAGIARGFMERAAQRERIRQESEIRKGEQLAQVYGQEAQGKSNALANLISAYRAALE